MHEEDRGLSLDFVISIATVLVGSRAADNNLSIEVQWIALLLGSKVRAVIYLLCEVIFQGDSGSEFSNDVCD